MSKPGHLHPSEEHGSFHLGNRGYQLQQHATLTLSVQNFQHFEKSIPLQVTATRLRHFSFCTVASWSTK